MKVGVVLVSVGLAAATVLALFVGAAGLTPLEVWEGLIGTDQSSAGVVRNIRLPRILAALLAGGGLAAAGVGLQAAFRNEMADPFLLGGASAAGLGVGLAGLLGWSSGSLFAAVLAGGFAIVWAILLGRVRDESESASGFVLLGLGMTFALLGWTLALIFAFQSPRLPTFTYFVFGGLSATGWAQIAVALPLLVVGAVGLSRRARALDVLATGDRHAKGLGVDPKWIRRRVLLAAALATAGSVLLAGVVGFVALLAAPVGRKLVGPDFRRLLPVAILVGAGIVLLADTGVRSLPIPVEVPIGVVTAAVGGPLLVVMALGRRQL